MDSSQSALVGFAVLRANYNADAPNYIDNFTNFVVDVLVRAYPQVLDAHTGADQIHESFGIRIPDLVVEKIFLSAVRLKLATGVRGKYAASERALKSSGSITADIQRYTRQQSDLVQKFEVFVQTKYPEHIKLLQADLAEELSLYFQANAIPLLAQSLRGVRAPQAEPAPGFEYLISGFIADLASSDQVGFSYVEDAAKGAILAAVVELDTSSFAQSLKSLSIYLDTPVLIDLLGFHGDVSRNAMAQFVRLARHLGASVCVFEHSMRELEAILQSAESFLKGGRLPANLPRTVLHFQDSGMSAVDVALAREKLPELIRDAGVKVQEKPGDYAKYGLDESELDVSLQKAINYKFPSARRHDVDSISAIHRLRGGSSLNKLEKIGFVFVTNNIELARAGARIESERHAWPLIMTEVALASLMWIRSPTVDADLPRTFLLATAYAGMQPDGRLWQKYLDEVQQLEKRGTVNNNDALLLRTSNVAKTALMEETLGITDAVSADEVLRRLREEIARPFLEAANASDAAAVAAMAGAEDAARTSDEKARVIAELSAQNQSKLDSEHARDQKIQSDGDRRGKHVTIGIVLLLALGFGAVTFVTASMDNVWPAVKIVSGILTPLLVLLAVLTAVLPDAISDLAVAPLQKRISKTYVRRIRRTAGLPPLQAGSASSASGTSRRVSLD